MSISDTLELDAIIQEWNPENSGTVNVEKSNGHNLRGIKTNTAIFDPTKSGEHIININGQEIFINVEDKSINKEVDFFEDENIDEYSGSTNVFNITDGTTDGLTTPREGSSMLREYISGGNAQIVSTSGLPNYPSSGDDFRCLTYFGSQSGFQGGESIKTYFGVQSDVSASYAITLSPPRNEIGFRIDNSVVKTVPATINGDTWYQKRFNWGSNGDIDVDIVNIDGDNIGSLSITNSKYTSGGVGFGHNAGGNSGYWDEFKTQ